MIFSILLTIILLFMAGYTLVFLQRRLGQLMLVGYFCILVVVWQPQVSTFIARQLGIGRGLDLFLMLGAVIIINTIIVITRHISLLHQQQTTLVRNIALHRAQNATLPDLTSTALRAATSEATIHHPGHSA